eukprot:scaffold82090_cov31-Prasinocladus_malaysianus.AAC.2
MSLTCETAGWRITRRRCLTGWCCLGRSRSGGLACSATTMMRYTFGVPDFLADAAAYSPQKSYSSKPRKPGTRTGAEWAHYKCLLCP